MPFPLSLCQRHPRYATLLASLVVFTLFLLSSSHPEHQSRSAYTTGSPPDPSLPARVSRAEDIYKGVLDQRDGLIKKFGPTPAQVAMFPPDQDPWPAYTVWDFFPPAFNCPHETERIGALGDGGKWVCGISRLVDKPDCVVYAFGIDWDSSFEAELLKRTHYCEIWGYDYTAKSFGSQIARSDRHRTHFAKVGLGATDSHGKGDDPKLWTLKSLMKANGHSHVDLVRIDIEGWEFDTMRALIQDFVPSAGSGRTEDEAAEERGVLPFGQLLIELHLWQKRFQDFLGWWEMLEEAGLRPFMSEANMVYANYNKLSGVELSEYSFVNIRGKNIFTSDRAPPTRALDGPSERQREDTDGDATLVGAKGVRYTAPAV